MEFRKKSKSHRLFVWLFIVAIVLATFIFFYNYEPEKGLPSQACFNNDLCIDLELAMTADEKQTGLMFRESLEENAGMLFIYEGKSLKKFWMKNTLIPLDIIWFDENNRIIYIEHNTKPCKVDPCEIYGPEFGSKNILEVNSGFTEENNININDFVYFR